MRKRGGLEAFSICDKRGQGDIALNVVRMQLRVARDC